MDEPPVEASQEEREDEMEDDGEKENPFSSPREVYERLIEVVNNESSTEEVLPYEETVVDFTLQQINYMTEGLEKYKSKLVTFVAEQHAIELGRIKFMIANYFRTRLFKLETRASEFVRLLRSDPKKACDILSPIEIKYLDNYVSQLDEYLDDVVLRHMPANLRNFKIGHIPNNPSSADNEFVFVKCHEPTEVSIDDPLTGHNIVDMTPDITYFLPFSALKPKFLQRSDNLHIV